MFLIDILIYVIFAIVLSYLALNSIYFYGRKNNIDIYLILFIIFFTIIAGIRWNVGSDSISYAYIFHNNYIPNASKELLWKAMVSFIYNLGLHWCLGLALCAFLQIYFIIKCLKNYKYILLALPFVLFGCRYWQDMMGAVRQMIVSCAFLWASKYIINRNILKYFIFVFVSSLIHQSALLLTIFYFIPNIKIINKRCFLIAILLVSLIIGRISSFYNFTGIINNLASLLGYETYGERMGKMIIEGNTEELAFGPMMLSYFLISIFIVWYGPKLKSKYGNGEIPCFNLWYNLSYIYACLYFLLSNLGHLFIRPLLYLELFQMVMLSLLLYDFYKENIRNKGMSIRFIIFCMVISLNSFWNIYKSSGKTFDIATYKVFFMHKDQVSLFNL